MTRGEAIGSRLLFHKTMSVVSPVEADQTRKFRIEPPGVPSLISSSSSRRVGLLTIKGLSYSKRSGAAIQDLSGHSVTRIESLILSISERSLKNG